MGGSWTFMGGSSTELPGQANAGYNENFHAG